MELARTKHGATAATIARRRHLQVRTVYRDLRALQDVGFPLTTGAGGRWKLVDGWEARVPFPLPLEQLAALYISRGLMRPLRGTPFARSFDLLFERLAGGPISDGENGHGELFPRLRTYLAFRSHLAIDYADHRAVLETVCRACEIRATVRAVYYTETRRELTRRNIDPYALYYDPQLEAIYLFGWCHLREEVRTFAVHRFRQAAMTEQRFKAPSGFSPERHLRAAFRIWRGDNTFAARIAIDPEAAGWVSERQWHSSQKVRRVAGGGCELSFTVDGDRELLRFVLQLGAAAEVIDPAWFRRAVAEEQTRAARRNRHRPQERLTLDDTSVRDTRRSS